MFVGDSRKFVLAKISRYTVIINEHDAHWLKDTGKLTGLKATSDHLSKCSTGIVPPGALQSGGYSVDAHLQQPQSGYQPTPGPSQKLHQQGMTA